MARVFVDIFGLLNGGFDVQRTAINACRAKYAVVPVIAGGKAPMCTLNTREKREQGRDHSCGVAHAITDPEVADKVFGRLTRNGVEVNIGVVAAPSRLVVVDADTSVEVDAFRAGWAAMEGTVYLAVKPTVWTPGAKNDDGTWRHQGGGHFYFYLPEGVELDHDRVGSMKLNGYDVRWGMSQTLVPPSRRAEGPYRASGADMTECPEWLLEKIRAHIDRVVERRLERAAMTANDAVAQWSIETPWDTLLERHDWTPTGKTDRCSCAIWTRPGGGSTSYKSATAHEADCVLYDNIEGHGPLHVWSTEIEGPLRPLIEAGQQTFTKLTFVAVMEYDGDTTAAMVALKITPDLSDWDLSLEDEVAAAAEPSQASSSLWQTWLRSARAEADLLGLPTDGEHAKHRKWFIDQVMIAKIRGGRTQTSTAEAWMASPGFIEEFCKADDLIRPSLLVRTDRTALMLTGRTNSIVGPRGAGKTMLACHLAHQVLDDGGRALVYDLEDTMSAYRERMIAIGCDADGCAKDGRLVWVNPPGLPLETDMDRLIDYAGGFDVVVFDTMNRLISRKGGDVASGNSEILWLFDNLFDPIAGRGAGVVILDHPPKRGQRKDASLADMDPVGGAMKLNNVSGHAISLSPQRYFTRDDANGFVYLTSLKDRTGHFPQGELVGEFCGKLGVSSIGGTGLSLRVDKPGDPPPEPTVEELVAAKEAALKLVEDRIIAILRSATVPWSGPQLKRELSKKQQEDFDTALENVVQRGEVVSEGNGKKDMRFRLSTTEGNGA